MKKAVIDKLFSISSIFVHHFAHKVQYDKDVAGSRLLLLFQWLPEAYSGAPKLFSPLIFPQGPAGFCRAFAYAVRKPLRWVFFDNLVPRLARFRWIFCGKFKGLRCF